MRVTCCRGKTRPEKKKSGGRKSARMLATGEETNPSERADLSPLEWGCPSNKENHSKRMDESRLETPMPWRFTSRNTRQRQTGRQRSSQTKKGRDFKPKEDASAARSRDT